MTRRFLASITTGAGLLLLSGAVNAAQLTVDPVKPFDGISMDVAGGDAKALKDSWNAELRERCEIIVANPAQFKDEHLQLCMTVLGDDDEGLRL